jgi:hypothetical protein
MSGTSARSFEFVQWVHAKENRVSDFSEFDQVAYIREALHGQEKYKSRFADGVCAALCVYVLTEWLNNDKASRKTPVDRLCMDCNDQNSVRPSIQFVEELATTLDDGKGWQKIVESSIFNTSKRKKAGASAEVNVAGAVRASLSYGPTFVAIGGLFNDGHAILCDASKRAVFDPNYGYYEGHAMAGGYQFVLDAILKKYSDGNAVLTTFLPY